LGSGKVLLASRLLLGSILIAASLGKLANPDAFVNLVASYNILPESLAQPFGICLPWVELIVGAMLILGVFPRLASGISIMLIASFMIASSSSLLSGAGASCGCFGEVMPLSHTQSLLVDGAMLLMTAPFLLRRGEPWLAIPRSSASRALFSTMAIVLVLGSFMPQATAAAAVNTNETPATLSQQAASNTSFCDNEVPVEADNVIKVDSGVSYEQGLLDQTIVNSLQTSDAVFLFFYTDWCGFCKKESPIIDELEQQYAGQISFIRINSDDNPQVKEEFGVSGFPTMFLISDRTAAGEYQQQQFRGFTEGETLGESFNQVIDGGSIYTGAPFGTSPLNLVADVFADPGMPFSVPSSQIIDCSGVNNCGYYGTCVGDNVCECLPGWYGAECSEYYMCYGNVSIYPEVCNGGGECVGTDTCVCDPYHYGSQCENELYCYGSYATEPDVCSGNGDCAGNDVCECYYGWGGVLCDERLDVCDGYFSDDTDVCSSRGECVDVGGETWQCVCEEGWGGTRCDIPYVCDGQVGPEACAGTNGTCVGNNICECNFPYTGDTCQDVVQCEGVPAADTDNVCSGFGVCTADGTCICDEEHMGADCAAKIQCYGLNYDDPDVCSSNGACVAIDTCVCGAVGEGENCSEPPAEAITCDGLDSTDVNVCSGNGTCVEPDTCVCYPNWEGADCEQNTDACPNDPNKIEPGACGCGVQDTDSDGDDVADCNDQCPNDSNKIEPGACGCDVVDTDADEDGIADCVDNCPNMANPGQQDSDANGIGDACDTVYATVDIDPNSLNLKSKGAKNAVTAYIELPMGANASEVDINTVTLNVNGTIIAAEEKPTSVGDHDNDGITDIMVKFNRQKLIDELLDIELSTWGKISKWLGWKVNFKLVVDGYLSDGSNFTGEDTIKVILPRK
ncbi:MauE/DoxX family redox-associated membrane protein, partial [Chloroflexota bacterium]